MCTPPEVHEVLLRGAIEVDDEGGDLTIEPSYVNPNVRFVGIRPMPDVVIETDFKRADDKDPSTSLC